MATIEHDQDRAGGTLLSVRRAAVRLGIGRGTTYRLIREGVLPAVRVGGSIRVDPRELDRWLEEHRTTGGGSDA